MVKRILSVGKFAAQAECAQKLQALQADRAALDARIKAFQDKVAALSV